MVIQETRHTGYIAYKLEDILVIIVCAVFNGTDILSNIILYAENCMDLFSEIFVYLLFLLKK